MQPVYIITAVPIVATAFFAVATIILRRRNLSFYGTVCKFMSSFCFVSIAIVGYCFNPKNPYYFCLIVFCLLFGLGGDVLLGVKEIAPKFREKLIPLGTLYFLVSHFFAIAAFISIGGFRVIPLICGIGAGFVAFAIVKAFKMRLSGKLLPFMVFYYAVLCYKTAAAAMLYYETKEFSVLIALIGAVLFTVSDTFLGILYFTPVKRKNFFVTIELSTYYTAQTLMATSIILM